ncbi:hypothetical protein IFM89_017277 [Coptis chinensis]|uniref:Pectinesterase inhibitor domain-containing protein n=1 Tax=Coptis chinensis TaxID=261450 RepID=A0A835ICP2_9MAGN|nr:hypothetical protein IFM89_017277 [Coptis chinensis]
MASLRSSMAFVLHVLVFCFLFHGSSAADQEQITKVCNRVPPKDFTFCNKTLFEDPRTPAATIQGLCTIASGLSIDLVRDTIDNIDGFLRNSTDPVINERLEYCRKNYASAYDDFYNAWKASLNNSFVDVVNSVRSGTSRGIDCLNGFRKRQFVETSPVAEMTYELVTFEGIIFSITQELLPSNGISEHGTSRGSLVGTHMIYILQTHTTLDGAKRTLQEIEGPPLLGLEE